MKIKTTTRVFRFIDVSFYESSASPSFVFESAISGLEEYEEEDDFDFDKYCNDFIPYIQNWANTVAENMKEYGLNGIKVESIGHPREYNFYSDWANIEIDIDDNWDNMALSKIKELIKDKKCIEYFNNNFKTVSGYIFFGPESWNDFEEELKSPENKMEILLGMYFTLAFIKEIGNYASHQWNEVIVEEAMWNLSYNDYATIKILIPEGSEYLFKDVHTAEADEIYHKVLDKYGWAWKEKKYQSETELCAMLKWAKEKGMSIEDLKG